MMSQQKEGTKWKMLDIHTHCLPTMDDGAKNTEESKRMLRDSFSQGVEICVATPHCIIHSQVDIIGFIDKRSIKYRELDEELRKDKFGYPKLKLGAEVYLDNDISKYDNLKNLCIGDSSYMLLEIPHHIKMTLLSEWIYNLSLKGIKPIIAHIDRYNNWKEIISEIDNEKTVFQVNASRFLSFYGRIFISNFLKYKDCFIVSSDMHNMSSRRCNMRKAYEKAFKIYGNSADNMFGNEAKKIIKG